MNVRPIVTGVFVILVALPVGSIAHGQGRTLTPSESPRSDVAEKLLADSSAITKSLQTLTAQIAFSWGSEHALKKNVGSVKLMKPNYALMTLTGDYPLVTLASDGQSLYQLSSPTKYTVVNAGPHGENIETPWWALPLRFFFTQNFKPYGPQSPTWSSSRFSGQETINGEILSVAEVAGEKPRPYVARFYFDARKLFRRSVVIFGQGPNAAIFTAELQDVRIDKRFRPAEFRFTPTAEAKLDTGAESKLLSLGETGPDFSLPTPDGEVLTLSNLRRGKKATLLNFWFVACPPCREEFPLFQKLYLNFKDNGLAIVGVNKLDDATRIKSFISQSGITFPNVMGERDIPGVFASYHVEAYPSTYVLNSEGKIIYRSVGVNEATLLQALRKAGLEE